MPLASDVARYRDVVARGLLITEASGVQGDKYGLFQTIFFLSQSLQCDSSRHPQYFQVFLSYLCMQTFTLEFLPFTLALSPCPSHINPSLL